LIEAVAGSRNWIGARAFTAAIDHLRTYVARPSYLWTTAWRPGLRCLPPLRRCGSSRQDASW
jgi:hypothetical protein